MQISKNEPSNLNEFIADLKKLGFEVEINGKNLGFMMPDKDGKPTFMVSLPIDRYDFYPFTHSIHNNSSHIMAGEKSDYEFKNVVYVNKNGNINIYKTPVYYED